MKKIIVIILVLVSSGYCADRAGMSDSISRANYLSAIYARIANATTKPYNIYDTASVVTCLDQALLSISGKFMDAVERKDTIITSAGQGWYSLNADCEEIIHVSRSASEKGLDTISLKQIGYRTSPDDEVPQFYVKWGNAIYIDRVNVGSDTLFVYYQARANKMATDTTTSNVRAKYFDIVVDETVGCLRGINAVETK